MRILFVTYSEKTHFYAMVPLAWALRTAGHEVRVASQPELADVITDTGLTAVPVGKDHNFWSGSKRFLTKRFAEVHNEAYKRMRGVELPPFDVAELPTDEISWDYLKKGYDDVVPSWYRKINEPMVESLVTYCRQWRPDLVIWEPATYAGPIAAKASGAVHARLPWSLDFFGRSRSHFLRLRERQPAENRGDALGEWIASLAAEFGADYSEDMTTGQFTIDQFPDSLRLEGDLTYLPMRYIPYNSTSIVPSWLWAPPARPRVCLTLGISATERLNGYLIEVQDILDSLADLDIELVATLPDEEREKLRRIPDNTRIVPFVPLHALVPTCTVAIHHGGFGTVNTISLYGVPQLSLPEQHDALPLARRLSARGVGLTLYYSDVTGPKVREHLLRLLSDDSFVSAAGRLREEMLAMPSPNQVVPEIERLVAHHSSAATVA